MGKGFINVPKEMTPPSKSRYGAKPASTKAIEDEAPEALKKGGMAGGKWIKEAIKKPGAIRAQLGAKEGKPIPAKKLAAAAKKPGKMGQRARLAETLKGMKK